MRGLAPGKLRRAERGWAVAAFLVPLAPSGVLAQQCMHVGARSLDPTHYFYPGHACSSCDAQLANRCTGINRVVAPDYGVAEDLVIIPHRGVWGFPKGRGHPENTKESVECANQYWMKVVEVDVMRTADGKAVLNHYFSLA